MGGRAVTRDRAGRPGAAASATDLWLLGGTVGLGFGLETTMIVTIVVILENRRSST